MANEDKKSAENALPEASNEQIEQAGQSSGNTIMEVPAYSTALLYQNAAHSTGIMYQNSVSNQNNLNILGQAAANQGVMQIYSINTLTDTVYIDKILNPGNVRLAPTQLENNQPENDKKDEK